MDPCPFVRITVGNLGLKFPAEGFSSCKDTNLFYCKFKLKGFPSQYSAIRLVSKENDVSIENRIHACYSFSKSDIAERSISSGRRKSSSCGLNIEIYRGIGECRRRACGWKVGKYVGSVLVPLDLKAVEAGVLSGKNCVIEEGWVAVVGSKSGGSELYMNAKAEADPRFVFQFDAEPECSPQVFQVNGHIRQPVFTCKFGFRSSGENSLRSRSSRSEHSINRGCFSTVREQPSKERKGWSITIHDLSGSPVAAASMVTPFVASPGSNRVQKSNPGAWLILRPENGTWKPWGRLEGWREKIAGRDHLGYRFELMPEGSIDAITLANSAISTKNGGKFNIDIATGATPMISPDSSFDLSSGSISGSEQASGSGSGSWAHLLYRGFVMSSTVVADGKCDSKPVVEVGVQHVSCTEDAAAFVALAAAMDLSMDACKLFSKKLPKELRQPE